MNIREINDRLITGACRQDLAQLLLLLEVADPGLSMLSPLAKTAWRLHSDHNVSRDEAKKALSSTFIIASSYSAQEFLEGNDVTTGVIERVAHEINVQVETRLGPRCIPLQFESEGSIEYASAAEVALMYDELELALDSAQAPTQQYLFEAVEKYFRPNAPACYPCDTDFIGMITYRMKSVGDQAVGGPCITDYSHQIEFSELGLLQEQPKARDFCWLHQLTREQAEMLGLSRARGGQHDSEMPEWLDDDLTFSKVWISPEDLLESYSKGRLMDYEVDSLLLCLGAGSEWRPGATESQVDEIDGDLNQIRVYPEDQLPIRAFSLSKGVSCDEQDLGMVLQLLGQLVRTYRGDEN